jgi:5-methyltetrahydrofolate--homocysteine methyltransferase
MIIIAENLNTRNKTYMNAVKKKDKKALKELLKKIEDAGADIINLQCSLDGADDENTLPWVTEVLCHNVDCGISFDSRNVLAIKHALQICKRPSLINYLSDNEPDDQEALLSLISRSDTSLVIRASKGTIPTSLEAKLQIIEDLLEIANEADIPNERLFADPSIIHIEGGMGQRNILNSYECVKVIKDLVQPPLNTIAWISNISTGLPKTLRKPLEATFLSYMAGAGLDAAIVDVFDKHIKRALYLIKSFRDEIVFSKAEIA